MKYWPGTKIVKSNNNAFDWNTGEPCCMATLSRQIEFTKRSVAIMVEQRKKEGNKYYASPTNDFVTYSRAKAVRFS